MKNDRDTRTNPTKGQPIFDDDHADISFGTAHRPDLYSGQKLTDFWKGGFGDEYHKRNVGCIESNVEMFRFITDCNEMQIGSVLEFGAGTGMNLVAMKRIFPDIETIAVEINGEAVDALHACDKINATIARSILDFQPEVTAELVLTKGLLIHLAPETLPKAYEVLHAATRQWLLVCEYYCPTPREINYRGNEGKAWARDFAGEILDAYPDLNLVDYGFVYRRDKYPQDDLTWFLMEKTDG